jgi:hypothetical protein
VTSTQPSNTKIRAPKFDFLAALAPIAEAAHDVAAPRPKLVTEVALAALKGKQEELARTLLAVAAPQDTTAALTFTERYVGAHASSDELAFGEAILRAACERERVETQQGQQARIQLARQLEMQGLRPEAAQIWEELSSVNGEAAHRCASAALNVVPVRWDEAVRLLRQAAILSHHEAVPMLIDALLKKPDSTEADRAEALAWSSKQQAGHV